MSAIVLPRADGRGARGPAPLVVLGWTQPPHRCATTVHRCKRNACESISVPPLLCNIVFVTNPLLTDLQKLPLLITFTISDFYLTNDTENYHYFSLPIVMVPNCAPRTVWILNVDGRTKPVCLNDWSFFVLRCYCESLSSQIINTSSKTIHWRSATKEIFSSVKIIKRLPRHNEIGVTEHTLTTLLRNLAR